MGAVQQITHLQVLGSLGRAVLPYTILMAIVACGSPEFLKRVFIKVARSFMYGVTHPTIYDPLY